MRTFLTVLLVAAGSLAAAQAQAPRSLHDAFDARQCYRYTAQIAGFGERQPGQPGHAKVEQMVRRVVTKNGGRFETDEFSAQTPRGTFAGHNLIAKFHATNDPRQPIFILAGHYDTLMKPGFVGANDGGSSTAILLSFADALAHQTTRMQIWLVWTDLEEGTFVGNDGLYGSRHLAAKLSARGLVPRIKGFFLLDMIGDKDLGIARETQSTRSLQDVMANAAGQLGYSKYFFQYEAGITDDHVEFLNVGIPAVDVVDAEFGRMGPNFDSMGEFHHANTDTMDKVSATSLGIVGRTILLTIELIDKSTNEP